MAVLGLCFCARAFSSCCFNLQFPNDNVKHLSLVYLPSVYYGLNVYVPTKFIC